VAGTNATVYPTSVPAVITPDILYRRHVEGLWWSRVSHSSKGRQGSTKTFGSMSTTSALTPRRWMADEIGRIRPPPMTITVMSSSSHTSRTCLLAQEL
jgi:hypothetical protein